MGVLDVLGLFMFFYLLRKSDHVPLTFMLWVKITLLPQFIFMTIESDISCLQAFTYLKKSAALMTMDCVTRNITIPGNCFKLNISGVFYFLIWLFVQPIQLYYGVNLLQNHGHWQYQCKYFVKVVFGPFMLLQGFVAAKNYTKWKE